MCEAGTLSPLSAAGLVRLLHIGYFVLQTWARFLSQALFVVQELAAQRRLEYAEQIKADQELHDQLAAQRAQIRYSRHYDMCAAIVGDILDFASKVTEYRELTNKSVLFFLCFSC